MIPSSSPHAIARVLVALAAATLVCATLAPAQSSSSQRAASRGDTTSDAPPVRVKTAHAARLDGATVRIDGSMDEAAWGRATPIRDFVQKIPREGATPSVPTEVRILYDDAALYVGARLMRSDPRAIRQSVTRRDGESDAEVFTISLDTYHDRRTAYAFSISSGGVRGDAYHAQDSEDSGLEPQFDPVWSASVRVDSAGWTAELRIPFSQLRFNAADRQEWGLQLTRNVADKAERVQWVLIPVSAAGYSSRFGLLEGIAGIAPTRRIELLPYVASDLTLRSNVDPRNPFNDKLGARAGADLKVGLGPNLSLDATLNPDFGQVEADPAVVNLTAFEQVFEERRPFFVEGNELLTGRGASFIGRPNWFYSRRIGAAPRGTAAGDFVDVPTNTTITTAAKVTGRLARGLSLGALAAVTPREFARTFNVDSGTIGRTAVEPPALFGVIRLQQEFGAQQSNLGMSLTSVSRALDDHAGLRQLLPSDAVAGGIDWKLRYRQGMYEVTGWLGGSRVTGDAGAIARLQRNSAHFFQRPDQDYLTYDPTRTSLSGATASIRLDKNAGRFTLGGIQLSTRTPGFEINDAGQMRSGDDIDFNADIQLRDTKPNRYVRFYQLGTSTVGSWSYGGVRQYLRFNQTAQAVLHSFLKLNARGTLYVPSFSDDLTRGGPLIATPAGYSVLGQVTSRSNVPTTWNARTEYYHDAFGGSRWDVSTGVATRPAPQWQGSVDPTYSHSVDARQYVATRSGGLSATYGQRYIFAAVERSTLSARFRINYALTPNFTIEGYAEPFAASGRFYGFGEVPSPRSKVLRVYGAAATGTTIDPHADGTASVTDGANSFVLPALDFQRLSFRSNLVLRWEWLPGSTAFFVWQQSRFGQVLDGELVRPQDLWNSVRADGDNFVVMKVSYWIGRR
ncbi:MAG: DUF5916 domain-containing protein [Gemmatimonadota bacterium]